MLRIFRSQEIRGTIQLMKVEHSHRKKESIGLANQNKGGHYKKTNR